MKIQIIMYVLLCEIMIGDLVFNQVHDVEITKSWRSLGNTCTIMLPNRKPVNVQKTLLEEDIKVGQKVSVKLWYDNELIHTEFEGYVSRVKATVPFEVECEDEVYFFRSTPLKKTFIEKSSLKEVCQYLVDEVNKKYPDALVGISKEIPSVPFAPGYVIASGKTAASELEKIREENGLVSYFRNRELFTGLSEQRTFGPVKHNLTWNVIEDDLIFRTTDDRKIKIKPVGFTLDNKKITPKKEVGDADGELMTIHYRNVTTESDLLKLAENDLTKYKYEGFEGSITTFLIPYAEPLMTCVLTDPSYNGARSGRYQIDSVKVTFGQNGARRIIELGKKLSA